MAGASVSDIAFPLSFTEATNHMTTAQRQCTVKAPVTTSIWWLRSPGDGATRARRINGGTGNFDIDLAALPHAVRPVL